MNKEFIKKIIKAEKLKYEALKEILPNSVREKVDEFEKETFDLLKDIAFEMIKEDVPAKKSTKKVEVDFS